eukprot:1158109-Pelagomonas_calceolata.AAC.2
MRLATASSYILSAFPSSCVHEGACLVACLSNHVEPGVLLFLQRAQAHDHSHEAMREHAHAHPHVAMRKPILPEVRLQELWMQDLSNNQAVHDSAAGWRVQRKSLRCLRRGCMMCGCRS